MKKIYLIVLTLSIFYINGQSLSDYNLLIKNQEQKGLNLETIISTPLNQDITIISNDKLNAENIELIGKTYTTFFTWDELNIKESKLIFNNNKLSVIIIPNSFNYNGVDFSDFLPSGFQIYYDTFYEYDFRMFKDSLFLRLKGQFYSKEEFLDELIKAVDDPLLYVQIHDPSYLVRQIDELKAINSQQNNELKETKELLQNLIEEHNKLLNAVVTLDNRSIFGALEPYSKESIEKIIDIKIKKPTATVKDVITELKNSGIKASNKLVESIFIVYFTEFPQNE
ncbi:MAG: hypothetical protein JXR64_02775 [Spirochaetales bacterium]|nr:hypothetical protein [Spirochaetales bacterium]